MIIIWKNSKLAQLNYYRDSVWVWNINIEAGVNLKLYYTGAIYLGKQLLRRGIGF